MRKMDEAEWRAFLQTGARTAKCATVRANGRPHIAPVWFLLKEGDIWFTTWHESVKAKCLQRDPRLALCVEDDRPPFSYVSVDGRAEFVDDAAQLLGVATELGGRYMGTGRADDFGRRNAVPGELLVRVRIERVIGFADVSA